MVARGTSRFWDFCILSALIVGAPVAARANLVNNGAFSGSVSGSQQVLTGVVSFPTNEWTAVGSISWIGTQWVNPQGVASDNGAHSVDLNGTTSGGIYQFIPTTVGLSYTVSFDLSGDPSAGPAVKSLIVQAGNSQEILNYDTTGNSFASMNWQAQSLTFTAVSPSTKLIFLSLDNGLNAGGAAIADVGVRATPEPGFYGVLSIGLAGTFYALRRRRHNS